MRKVLLVASICSIFCGLNSAMATGVSFEHARVMMHERADMLKMSEADVEHKRNLVNESRSLSGPKISLNAQQVEGRKDIHMAFDNPLSGIGASLSHIPGMAGLGGALGSNKFKIDMEEDISGPRASVDLIWPLYTGGAISAKQGASEAALRQAQAGRDKTRDELDAMLVQKYFAVQLARSVEKLRSDLLKQEERDLNRAKKFEKAGMIAKIERMSAQVNRDAAEREYIGSQTDRKVAEAELADLLREETIGALDTPMFITKDLKTLGYWQDLALSSNPTLKALEAQQEQARFGVKAAKGAFHPQVYLFGHYNMIKHYLTLPEPDWVAGIGVSFTLWDNRDRSSRVGSAQALANKAQAAHSQARNEISKVVEVAWLKSTQALEQFELTTSTINLARENVKLRERSFKEGLSTVDDVNDARNKLIEAEVARRVAAYRFVVAYSLLHAASGRMLDFMDCFTRPNVTVIENE